MVRRLGIALAVIVGCFVLSATPGVAATQVAVDCGAGANLQAAINAAPKGAILDISGTCTGTFTVGKNLVLRGGSNAVLDAQRAGTTLTVSAGNVRVAKLTVTGGEGEDGAGGIQNEGTLTLVHVTVRANDNGDAGGILNDGTLLMQLSLVTHDSGGAAGGIWNLGNATIQQSSVTFSGESGITNGGWPAIPASLTLMDSTVSNNGSDPQGGGIENVAGSVAIIRSTIANNSSGNSGGGGIDNHGALTVVASTIAGNMADEGGGGILNFQTAELTATIVAGNTDSNDGSPDNCGGLVTSNGYNLFGTPCGSTRSTDQVGTFDQPLDPILKQLGSYGGPTQTMVPRPASPAVNAIPVGAISADDTVALCPASGTTDQRGIPRPQGGACEIGSVERKPKQ